MSEAERKRLLVEAHAPERPPESPAVEEPRPPESSRPRRVGGWTIDFEGSGSRPAFTDGRLFIGSDDGALCAFDEATGARNWRFEIGEALRAPGASKVSGLRRIDMRPIVADGTVFVGASDGLFYALDAASGAKRWEYRAGGGMARRIKTSMPVEAPILLDGAVHFVSDEGLHAVDAATGKRRWLFDALPGVAAAKTDPERLRSPSPPLLHDGVFLVTAWPFEQRGASKHSFVCAVVPATGSAKWVATIDEIFPSDPVAVGGLVFVTTQPDLLHHNRHATLRTFDVADGTPRWTVDAGRTIGTPRLIVVGDAVACATDRSLLVVDAATGRERFRFADEGLQMDLAADDRRVFAVTFRDVLLGSKWTVHAFDLATGHELWSRKSLVTGDLGVADGVLYGTGKGIAAFDAASGAPRWSIDDDAPNGAAVFHDGRLFSASGTVEFFGTSRRIQGRLHAVDVASGDH